MEHLKETLQNIGFTKEELLGIYGDLNDELEDTNDEHGQNILKNHLNLVKELISESPKEEQEDEKEQEVKEKEEQTTDIPETIAKAYFTKVINEIFQSLINLLNTGLFFTDEDIDYLKDEARLLREQIINTIWKLEEESNNE